MIPTLETDMNLDDGDILCCPSCREANLHQGNILAYQRHHEDGTGRKTHVPSSGDVPLHSLVDDSDIPGRRDSLEIEFSCEHCHGEEKPSNPYVLVIRQHKGTTYIHWRG